MGKGKTATWRPPIRILPALPLEILLHHRPPLVAMERAPNDYVFKCSPGPRVEATFEEQLLGKNVYEIRDGFFRVKAPAEAFEFLSAYSKFLDPSESAAEFVLSWTEFQLWQELLKQISLNGFPFYYDGSEVPSGWRFFGGEELPEELQSLISASMSEATSNWLQGIPSHINIKKHAPEFLKLHPDEPIGKCNVFVASIVEAILATIYFNDLVGINYKKCSCEGCEEIYEERTSHERRFCSNKCAHTQGTRDRRKLAKQKAKNLTAAKRVVKQAGRKKNV
jgi:hypothetical protein